MFSLPGTVSFVNSGLSPCLDTMHLSDCSVILVFVLTLNICECVRRVHSLYYNFVLLQEQKDDRLQYLVTEPCWIAVAVNSNGSLLDQQPQGEVQELGPGRA